MTVLLPAPRPVAAPGPSRRRWPLPALAAALALAGVAATLVLTAPRVVAFAPVVPVATGAPYVTVPEFGPRGSHVLGYVHGASVRLTLPLHNAGWLPVTVTTADLGGGPAPLLAVRASEGLPLTLRPGGSGAVTLTISLVNCRFYNEREMQTYDGVRLGVRSLGMAADRLVPLDRPILVKSPMIATCPDRKLDRSANRLANLR